MFEQIKKGFFIGIGLIIPLAILELTLIKFATPILMSSFEEGFDGMSYSDEIEGIPDFENFDLNKSYADQVSVESQEHVMQGTQLLVRGQLKNNSDKELSNVTIEAELLDINGKFVYECSDYIDEKLKPGQVINYLITCGCSKNGLPVFESIEVNVKSAMSFSF